MMSSANVHLVMYLIALTFRKSVKVDLENNHTGKAAKEYVNTIDERRSKIVRNRVFDCHLSPDWRQRQSKTLFLAIFDRCSSIVKSDFDCRLSVVITVLIEFHYLITFDKYR